MNLILFAIAPVFIIIFYIYIKDKYEKEPKRLLLYNFLLGAIVSILVTTILYFIFDYVLPLQDKYSIFQQFIKAFFVVGLTEEFSKYIIVRYYAQPKPAYNEPFDGIVYAVMVSMGFAATENIFYVLDGGYQTAIVRAFTAVPAHATFGILMGYFMGKAKFSKNKIGLNLVGLLLAILFHGAYDFFLFIDFVPGIWVGAFISLFIGIVLSKKAIKNHQDRSQFKSV
ncbi:MAG: PrsW family intramembrane metalloprotease [Flavobacteriales bacterium]|nr:PrsW family intramembrane metalloprotease [Flavobacteriia bacterium]NCP06165.1 PrsW family intramembrane metalloprotease [Flavobacteriales bacterium]PIV94155.1 MAG: PrsW family intramembrane metalloprotease [Flavobacteriaceae bacterium CG17_big_fil_post_rev_8_21_14_2_50_33_15]PIY09594.1 MAG: PrsW family intramembrane metalloprotease [Flavobacteriaceae bacterium CG_4_10_14_3_um_filter_33_47]PJB17375.1 MAG: PrsW family intramembrane metalloprotease [Flavobacteriaceae bacterium CG_4_9_14_3_um_f